MINDVDNKYHDLIFPQEIHILNHHTIPYKEVELFCVNSKENKEKTVTTTVMQQMYQLCYTLV
jgi:hypothetical protein